MGERWHDGSAGDADYGAIGRAYAAHRQPEPAIVAVAERLPFPDKQYDTAVTTFTVLRWVRLTDQPWRIMSLGLRTWAHEC